MKLRYFVPILIISAIAFSVTAQQKKKGKGKGGPQIKWRVQQLHKDNNEGIAVGDIDGDTVGDSVGDTVGDVVGELVGDTVGDVVGDAVGETHPAHVTVQFSATSSLLSHSPCD